MHVRMQVKMQSVGAGAYDQRLGTVVKARGLLEEQLRQRLVLLEGYSRISSMIEIEVEMNTSVRLPCMTSAHLCLQQLQSRGCMQTLHCVIC
jgi:stage V sporulation protein SpoVS